MWYIGTSLGKCLKSILEGEVSEKDVMMIIAATSAPTFDQFMQVVDLYYKKGNYYSNNPELYEVSGVTEDDYKGLAERLWKGGKIHQPLLFPEHWGESNVIRGQIWLQIVPTNQNSTPAVVDAYEKYKALDSLTKNG